MCWLLKTRRDVRIGRNGEQIHMRAEVRLYATMRRYALSSCAGWALANEVPERSTTADAIVKAGIDANEVP